MGTHDASWIRHRAFRYVRACLIHLFGFLVFWCSDVLFSCSWRGPQPRGRFSPRGPRSSFYSFFVSFFQTSFLTAIEPKSSQNWSSQTAKNHKKLQKKVTETHPQSGLVKRLGLAGAKPLKLTTLTTLSAVFPKAQSSQSRAKKTPKCKLRAPRIHKKSPQNNNEQDHEKLVRVSILVLETD